MTDFNDLNKDQRTRSRVKKFNVAVGVFVYKILGHTNYNDRNWERKIKLVKKATGQLEDPQFLLKQLESLIQQNKSSDLHIQTAESALKELQSFFLQSKHDIEDLSSPGLITAEALREAKEESMYFQEELKQITAMTEQKLQSLDEAKVYNVVARFLQKVVNCCSNSALYFIFNQDNANQIQGHSEVEINGEQLRINFPQTPDSIQINRKGKNVEVHNQEMIVQEKLGKEVTIILQLEAGRLAQLKLRGTTNQGMSGLPASFSWDLESISKFLLEEDVTGTSNAAANEVNVKSSTDETCLVQGYKVFKRNADALNEIFQVYSNIVENFQVTHPDIQSFYMNLLAEVYQKIMKSKQEIFEPDDIKNMEKMVGDMELVGLQVKMLKLKLEILEMNRELQKKGDMLEKTKRPLRGQDSMNGEYLDSFPLQIRNYVVKITDVLPDGHCGFRSIAESLGFGSDGWFKVRIDLFEELHMYRSYYVNFYESNEYIKELLDALLCFEIPAPKKHWMILPEMGHLIASRYNVILVHISAKQCLTYLPLQSSPPPTSEHRIIFIGFVNNNHFVQISMDSTSPIPPVACKWYKFRHHNAIGWETPYLARIQAFKSLISKDSDVATREIINLDDP